MSSHFDVVVAGGGMVGGLLSAALAGRAGEGEPLSVCVLEAARPAPFSPGSAASGALDAPGTLGAPEAPDAPSTPDEPPYDIRVSALSVASQRMFEAVGAWRGVIDRRACPFRRMRAWDGEEETAGGGARPGVEFDAHEIDVPLLGHIVENRVLQLALLEQLELMPHVELRCPARLTDYSVGVGVGIEASDRVSIALDSGENITAALLVGADGARSLVRRLAGIDMPRSEYEQRAMVATVSTDLPQQDITWQRFMPTGPQAMLPLCGQRASLVWYHDSDEIERLIALGDDEFIEALERDFPAELGGISAVHERASFPIARAHAASYLAERVALVGDACHTVHPLAGQGVNLGMLDAGALAETLRSAKASGTDIGSRRTLRRYERWRKGENATMASILDGFHRAFSPQPAPVRHVRAAAMNLAGRAGPARRLVTRHASGLAGDLPQLAR